MTSSPPIEGNWASDCKYQSRAVITSETITFSHVRAFNWRTTRDYDDVWDHQVSVPTSSIKNIWFMVDHFHPIRFLAHTYITFEFNDGRCLSLSFEVRRLKGQKYHPIRGFFKTYPLYLLVGYEEDVTFLRTNTRRHKVYMFKANPPDGKPEQLLRAYANYLNQLADHPKWYHSIMTTCNTSLVQMINTITPGRIPWLWRTFFPGHTPRAAYKLGLIEHWGDYQTTLDLARIDEYANKWSSSTKFSDHLRQKFN